MAILDDEADSKRRDFLRRSIVSIPVVIATVRARSVMAQDNQNMSAGCGSIAPGGSFCPPGGAETLMRPHGESQEGEPLYQSESFYRPGGDIDKE